MMKDWHILITDGLDDNGQAVLRLEAEVDDRSDIRATELLEVVGNYDALIVRGRTKVTAEVLAAGQAAGQAARQAAGQKLKVVGRAGVGVDNIDLEAARKRGVRVVNAPQSTSLAVAELTLALLLAISRQVSSADRSMKDGQWLKKQLEGVELNGKTLGIIGIGNIGRAVAARAAAFGMQVVAYDNTISEAEVSLRGAAPGEPGSAVRPGRLHHPARAPHRPNARHDRHRGYRPDETRRAAGMHRPRRGDR
jgi:D-3-phosphoglycerate dehydrogenase / 2-oxoglutarate reductase